MTALAHALGRRSNVQSTWMMDALLILLGAAVMSALGPLSIRLPFTPVPVSGQTLGVMLVGASLGAWRGALAMLLYLGEGAAGLPVFAEGHSGVMWLTSEPTTGYLWSFPVAAGVIGLLAQLGWDRNVGSAIGAMLVGEVIVFTFGVAWIAHLFKVSAEEARQLGLYPFIVGDLVKLALAAAALPTAWKLVGRGGGSGSGSGFGSGGMNMPSFKR